MYVLLLRANKPRKRWKMVLPNTAAPDVFFSRPTFITFGRGKHFVEKIQWNKDIDKELVSSEVLKPKMREVHDFPDWSIIHQVPFLEAVGKGSRVRDVDIAFRFVYYTILGECEHRQQNDEDMPFKAHPREAKLLVLTELDFRFRLKIHVRLLASAFVRPFRAESEQSRIMNVLSILEDNHDHHT